MTQSYTLTGGQGRRDPGVIAVTTTATGFSGDIRNLVDGRRTTSTSGDIIGWSGTVSGLELKFHFLARDQIVTEVTLGATGGGGGDWKWQGSTNGSTWTDIGSSFTWGSADQVVSLSANSTAYPWYRMLGVSGSLAGGPWIQEFEFKIDGGSFEVGNRSAACTVTTSLSLQFGIIQNIVNGPSSVGFANQAATGADITFDFGAASVVMKGIAWLGDNNNLAIANFKAQGWNGSSWVDLSTAFALGGEGAAKSGSDSYASVHTWSNSTGYKKYRLLGTSGTIASVPVVNEVDFITVPSAGATTRQPVVIICQ